MEAATDVVPVTELRSLAVAEQPAAASLALPAPRVRAVPEPRLRVTEPWVGRASICWLSCLLPLLLTSLDLVTVVTLALLAASTWFVAGVLTEESGKERRAAFGSVARSSWFALAGLAALSLLSAWAPGLSLPTGPLIASALLLAVLSAAWELLVQRTQLGRKRLLIVGGSRAALGLLETLGRARTPYTVAGVVCDEPLRAGLTGVPVLGRINDLARVVRAIEPDLVVIASEGQHQRVCKELTAAADLQLTVAGLAEFHEHVFGRLPVRQLSPAWFMSALHLYRRPYGRATKRLFDVAVATTGLVLTAPILAIVAVLLRCSGANVIYRQQRLGQSGRVFTILKFRTMSLGSELPGQPIWASERDPRVTRIGRVLRQLRLDELPQLVNVLAGDMSIVGPRPERPEYVELLTANVPFWSSRTMLKPGITGWAQVNAGYAADFESAETKLSYDLWYLRHRSLLVDVAICARTFGHLSAGAR
ncbi:MAG TPA: exopolysaccharide biosynthesis polyprenyl glycosylphosphotransferase [Gaiellaceae bacterium]